MKDQVIGRIAAGTATVRNGAVGLYVNHVLQTSQHDEALQLHTALWQNIISSNVIDEDLGGVGWGGIGPKPQNSYPSLLCFCG